MYMVLNPPVTLFKCVFLAIKQGSFKRKLQNLMPKTLGFDYFMWIEGLIKELNL